MRRARLELAVADLLIAARAFGTRSAGAHERNGHPVADLPPANQHSECSDATRQFVPCDVRERDTGIIALPAVPIAAADTGSLHLDHHAVGSRLRIGASRASGRTPNSLKMTALTLVRVAIASL